MNLLEQFIIFLQNHKNKPSSLTVKNYKADVAQFISWFEEQFEPPFDPLKITLQIIEQYKKSRKLSPSSIKRHVSSLRKFFCFLHIRGTISYDPLEKKAVSAQDQINEDPWRLKNYKNYLYEYKKSNLTIKNYISDIKNFFRWLSEVSLVKYAWDIGEKNLLNKVNPSAIEEYKQRLIASKFSPLTVNRKLSSLRGYVAWAEKQGFISSGHPEFLPANALHRQVQAGISGSPAIRQDSLQPNEMLKSPKRTFLSGGGAVQYDKETNYSPFPPFRLAQKTIKGADLLFDNLLILPIIETIEIIRYLFWKSTGKKVFTKNVIPNKASNDITNIKKEFYAPFDISVNYFPIHKKIWHYLKYSRPKWYKRYHSYSITHYFHFAILIVLASGIGFGIYNSIFADAQRQNAILGVASSAPPRILSFQGKLADFQSNPIINPTNILFSIYSSIDAPEKDFLWQESSLVKPDSDGAFSMLLGRNNSISDSIFSQNPALFLGVKVGDSPELAPRQQLATTSLAGNAQTLMGLEPITNTAKTSNVVLTLDSQGNLSIAGEKAHTFQTINSQFVLSGNVLTLTTAPGSNSNVEIAPDGLGEIDLSKPIHNSSNNNNVLSAIGAVEFDDSVAILATTSAQSAFTINQNSTGNLISAQTLGIAKFIVDGSGAGIFADDLQINGKNLTSVSTTFNLLNTGVTALNIGGEATTLILGTASGSASIKSDIILGNSNTNTITFTGRVAQDSSLMPITANGTNNLGSSDLPWDNAYVNNIYAIKLDVQDSQSATGAAQIFNTNTGTDADGLILKLGNTSSSAVAASNHFINFETSGIGIVGSVGGNEGKGVTYATSGIADFAEYLKKDKNQTIEYGSVVCLKDNGLVVKCDSYNNNIVGVTSQNPAFLGGENLADESVAVGLIGQVQTLVAITNGKIKTGDLLTASDIPGVAVKSTKAGQIVGKALENIDSIDELRVVGFYDPDNKEYRSRDNLPNIPKKPNIISIVKIYTLVNVSWYDPSAYLSSNGELTASSSVLNQTSADTQGFFEAIAASIKAGFINAREIAANSLTVTSEVISPVINADRLYTNIISPLASDSAITVNGKLVIDSSLEVKGNASFSGQLQTDQLLTDQLTANDATVSGTLKANRIFAESIEGLNAFVDIASYSGRFAYVEGLRAEQAQFNQGLMVFGPTSLSDLALAGQLSIGNTFFIADNSIEVLGADLSLQSLRQGGLSIMGGFVHVDTDGNLKTKGNLSVSGTGTFAKINFSLVAPALALSPTELIASSSAGTAKISPHQTEVTIRNTFVTENSVIYVTPVGTPSAQTPSLIRQAPNESASNQEASFTVGIQSPTLNPIPFNWLIVN
ncbi:MAG: site-specific integrase [Candidatus Levybacteria bacterium]|nr:site-specific integrase [Candidatus Levybacteria bacterium]